MGESTARDGRWEKGEHLDAVRPRVAVACCSTRSCEVAAKGVPVVCLTEYVTVRVGSKRMNNA